MKQGIHPKGYRPVLFTDVSSGAAFVVGSTIQTEKTGIYEGTEYPMVEIEVSSASHPVYTGADTRMDTTGRVERFRARAAKKK